MGSAAVKKKYDDDGMKIRRLADLRLDELKAALAEVCADWLMVPQRSFTARANGQLDSRCSLQIYHYPSHPHYRPSLSILHINDCYTTFL